jgi:hypothetical protein
VATARETGPEVADDLRFTVAADCIEAIAATLDQVPDDTLLRLASVNTATDGLMARLIAARLCAIGFELAPVDDALAFFLPIERTVEDFQSELQARWALEHRARWHRLVRAKHPALNLEANLAVGMTRPPLNMPRGIFFDPLLGFHLSASSAVKRQLQ